MHHFGGVFTRLVSWRSRDIGGPTGRSLARAARDFFEDFDVIAPENPKFSLVPMADGRHRTVMGIFLASLEPNPCPILNMKYS